MSNDALMAAVVRLSGQMEALAALAAHVRVEEEGLDCDPTVRALLAEVAAATVDGPVDADAPTSAAAVGMVRSLLRQAVDLVENPGRAGGWTHVDEQLLQGIGRLSMSVAGAIRAVEPVLDGLGERLARPGAALLDVGTGTGWLAIALARAHPSARVVGLDVFEPALELARANVRAESVGDRVDLRLLDVAAMNDEDVYDAVWLPMPFLPADVVRPAISACHRALRPGGWLLPGTFAGPPDALGQLMVRLRTVRAGGVPWQGAEIVELLTGAGLQGAIEVPRTWAAPVHLCAGQKPGS